MDYSFSKALSDSQKTEISAWIKNKLTELTGECDDVFLEYVMVMVSNMKTMKQISEDLIAFVGEKTSTEFATCLGSKLVVMDSADKRPSTPKQAVQSRVINTKASKNKTETESTSTSKPPDAGRTRLIQSALRSSIQPKKRELVLAPNHKNLANEESRQLSSKRGISSSPHEVTASVSSVIEGKRPRLSSVIHNPKTNKSQTEKLGSVEKTEEEGNESRAYQSKKGKQVAGLSSELASSRTSQPQSQPQTRSQAPPPPPPPPPTEKKPSKSVISSQLQQQQQQQAPGSWSGQGGAGMMGPGGGLGSCHGTGAPTGAAYMGMGMNAGMNPEAYNQQMNAMALMSGFRTAEEMFLAFQSNMSAMLARSMGGGGGARAGGGGGGGPGMGMAMGGMNSEAVLSQNTGYRGRGKRGKTHSQHRLDSQTSKPPLPPTPAPVASPSPAPIPVPSSAPAPVPVPVTSAPEGEEADVHEETAASDGNAGGRFSYSRGGFRGRGRGRGRAAFVRGDGAGREGERGRGRSDTGRGTSSRGRGPPAQNMKWVRPTDMESELTCGR